MSTQVKKAASPYAGEVGASLVKRYEEVLEKPYTDRFAVCEKAAEELGQSVRSVIAYLSRSGVYLKKEATTKAGGKIVKKAGIVDKLTDMVSMTEADASSLEKANKTALSSIVTELRNLHTTIDKMEEANS